MSPKKDKFPFQWGMKEFPSIVLESKKAKPKGPFTLSHSNSESGKDQRTIRKDQSESGKHQRKFSLSVSLSVNGPLISILGGFPTSQATDTMFTSKTKCPSLKAQA